MNSRSFAPITHFNQNEIEFLSSSTEFISGPTESPSDKKEESGSSMPEVKTVTQVCTFAGEQVK